jgi:uncharacterized iron-regulated membrane protein
MVSPEQSADHSLGPPQEQARGLWTRWVRQPQNTWVRKAIFQLHLWSGMILGLYVVVVCVSGSALVFRNDLYNIFETWDRTATFSQKTPAIRAAYVALSWLGDVHGKLLLGVNGMMVNAIGGFLTAALCLTGLVIWWPGIRRWKRALIVTGGVGWKRLNFDLHSAVGFWTFALLFMWGVTGGYFVFPQPFRAVINYFTPIDAPLVPRANNVAAQANNAAPQRVIASPTPGPPRGVYRPDRRGGPAGEPPTPAAAKMSVPQAAAGPMASAARPVNAAPQSSGPFPRRRRRPLTKGGKILQWFSFLHYGNFAGWTVKWIWFVLGLTPAILFGTAMVMWWNRVLSPALRRWRRGWSEAPANVSPELEWERE